MRHAVKCSMVGLALTLMVCGCSGDKANLVGSWVVDAEATRKAAQDSGMMEKMGAMEKKMFEQILGSMLGSMTVTFTKDKMTMSAMNQEQTAAYKVKNRSGKSVEIAADKDGEEAAMTIVFKSKNTMTMKGGPGGTNDMDFLIWKRK